MTQVAETAGRAEKEIEGHQRDPQSAKALEREPAAQRSGEVKATSAEAELAWSSYGSDGE